MNVLEAIETCRKLAKGFYNKKNMDHIRVGNEIEAVRSVLVSQEQEIERLHKTTDLLINSEVDYRDGDPVHIVPHASLRRLLKDEQT